jgi:hypothetical protein
MDLAKVEALAVLVRGLSPEERERLEFLLAGGGARW